MTNEGIWLPDLMREYWYIWWLVGYISFVVIVKHTYPKSSFTIGDAIAGVLFAGLGGFLAIAVVFVLSVESFSKFYRSSSNWRIF